MVDWCCRVLIGNGMWIAAIETAVLIACVNIFLPRFNGFFDRFAPAEIEPRSFTCATEVFEQRRGNYPNETAAIDDSPQAQTCNRSKAMISRTDRSGVVEAVVYCSRQRQCAGREPCWRAQHLPAGVLEQLDTDPFFRLTHRVVPFVWLARSCRSMQVSSIMEMCQRLTVPSVVTCCFSPIA
jgi:hypothetical protein